MRTETEIVRDLTMTQELMDRKLTEIGLLSARYFHSGETELKSEINSNVEIYQKLEHRLKGLENELKENKSS